MANLLKTVEKLVDEYDESAREIYSQQTQVPPILMDKLQDLDRSVWSLRISIQAIREDLAKVVSVLTKQN